MNVLSLYWMELNLKSFALTKRMSKKWRSTNLLGLIFWFDKTHLIIIPALSFTKYAKTAQVTFAAASWHAAALTSYPHFQVFPVIFCFIGLRVKIFRFNSGVNNLSEIRDASVRGNIALFWTVLLKHILFAFCNWIINLLSADPLSVSLFLKLLSGAFYPLLEEERFLEILLCSAPNCKISWHRAGSGQENWKSF